MFNVGTLVGLIVESLVVEAHVVEVRDVRWTLLDVNRVLRLGCRLLGDVVGHGCERSRAA